MGLYERVLRPLMFRLEAEKAHEIGMSAMRRGLVGSHRFEDPLLEQTLFGVEFKNPLGLAAGFDKNAFAINAWHRMGFGFVEFGTITAHAQPGNPRPRMFRIPEQKAIINRLGFNNRGAEAVAHRLRVASPQLPYGINLGKSKITELADAPRDYQESFRLLHEFADYFVVNVSSPNTPGLRTLQEKGPLLEILQAMREVDSTRPLFVKVAPDLEPAALDDLVQVAKDAKLTGLIATNTTIARDMLPAGAPNSEEGGGLSGAPLRERANNVLKHLSAACGSEMVLIGVGGIFDGKDLFDKIACGAHLCQVYTGFVYGGPAMAERSLRELAGLMRERGIGSLDELRGSRLAAG